MSLLAAAIAAARAASVESPRLSALEAAVARGDDRAIERFWDEVSHSGAPLVEPGSKDRERLVTFLWRSREDTRAVVLADFGDFVPHMTLERLSQTDVWFRSFRFPADARFFYELSVDDPAYPWVDRDPPGFPEAPRPDPLNPRQYDFTRPQIFSVVELPEAPALVANAPADPASPRGEVGRFADKFASAILGNERDVFVYRPSGYREDGDPYPLLLFGASYINQIRLPLILDRLIADARVPPVVAVFVGFPASAPGQNVQDEEAGGGTAFGDAMANELLPWIRERVHVTSDPRRVVIGGASAGGHSAAFVALRHPEAIGNVLAQSGAFWRGVGRTARWWGDPAHADGREGLARHVASRPGPAAPVRFHLTIGRLERGRAFDSDLISMLHASRHVRDVLEAKGYDVTLVETNGGHDPYNWEGTLPAALVALLGAPSAPALRREILPPGA